MPRRCAFGCSSKGTSLHRFPLAKKFPETFRAWVDLVGGKLETDSDFEYYKKKMVCDRHFTERDKNRYNRLNHLAIPSLYLSGAALIESKITNDNQDNIEASTSTGRSTIHFKTSQPGFIEDLNPQPLEETPAASLTSNARQLTISQAVKDDLNPQPLEETPVASLTSNARQFTISQAVKDDLNPQPLEETPAASLTSNARQFTVSQAVKDDLNPQPLEETPAASLTSNARQFTVSQAVKDDLNPQPLEETPAASLTSNARQFTVSKAVKGFYQNFVTAEQVLSEHNYCIVSKKRDTSGKDILKRRAGNCSNSTSVHTKMRSLRMEITRLRKKAITFKARLANAEKVFNNASFQTIIEKMTSASQLFVHMQLQTPKKPKGRRFTIEEKILSLSLYKKSPKCYKLLHKYFTLPSVKAMKRLLSQIKLCPGINPIIFKKIKATVDEKPVNDRLCSLIFDEMSLTPQVSYDAQKDSLEGFSFNKNDQFADHALVFMVKSIKNNFKQPVAYYFTTKLNKIELKTVIKEVISNCQNAGLIIINTVCDQSTVNVSAITEMVNETKSLYLRNGKEWRHDIIRVNKCNIIPIYDTPHLIKGIRNNLLTKDMSYVVNNKENIVKWEYFQKLYAADMSYGELRLLDKLTEEHINPEKINKMRVKSATQIFSHSVAVAAEHLSARGDLPIECKQLINITLLLDNLFDSLNVNSFNPVNGKKYKGAIRKNSCHHQLWKDAKIILKSIKFREAKILGNKSRLIEKVVPSVTNLIKTIEGMEAIWDVLSKKYHFDALFTRNFNQDPAENFFGNIRSYGARNNAPNSVAFQGAFKALLLNNYNSPHSNRSNCEEDSNTCLQSLNFFLNADTEASDVTMDEENFVCNEDIFNAIDVNNETDAGQRNYVCGWVLTKCLKNIVKGCKTCKYDLLDKTNENQNNNNFIRAKEYSNKKWLCYPNIQTERCFQEIQSIIVSFLKKDVPKFNVKKNITAFADLLVTFPFNCTKHKEILKQYFMNTTLNVILYSWCRSVNRILCGKLRYNGDDETKITAQQYYDKHKHYKNKK